VRRLEKAANFENIPGFITEFVFSYRIFYNLNRYNQLLIITVEKHFFVVCHLRCVQKKFFQSLNSQAIAMKIRSYSRAAFH
jgi:hypothetical protein